MRMEKDSLGEKKIRDTAYFGVQTQRSVENYPISGIRSHSFLIRAYALVKYAAARTNAEAGLLEDGRARAIQKAALEIAEGAFAEHFVVDVFQSGAGTALNMNMNEVIANRSLEILGHKRGEYGEVHPNDHVNMSQSTNDTYPTAMRIAVLFKLKEFYPALSKLAASFYKKGREFDSVITTARTHLQDAVPIRLGQEFTAYGITLEESLKDIKQNADDLLEVSIGGTAVGTGINTPHGYGRRVLRYLKAVTKLPLVASANLVESTQSQRQIAHISASLRNCAIEVNRIARDLRLLASGPNTGIAEITLPPAQPGSSIMPGKVNPSILECVNMVCFEVMGVDSTVALAVSGGELNLNVFMPLMSFKLLYAIEIFQNALTILREKCVAGIAANKARCLDYAFRSPSIITALNPLIGYAASAKIAEECIKTGKPIQAIILEKGILSQEQLNKLLDPFRLTEPGML